MTLKQVSHLQGPISKSVAGILITMALLIVATGCNCDAERVRVTTQEYSFSVRQECRKLEGVDWSVLEDKVDESMFDVCTIRVDGRQVRLLGFRPFIISTHQVTGSTMVTPHGELELITVAAGARPGMWLYLVNSRQGLFMAKWFTDQPAGDGVWMHPDEVIYAFRTQDRRLPFQLVREDKIQVDSRFFNLMLEHGLCPKDLLPVPDPHPTAQPVESQTILRVPGEEQ